MSLLEGVLSNPTVQRLAFGQLKGLFAEKDLDFILVRLDEQGEVMLDLYKKGEAKIEPILQKEAWVNETGHLVPNPERIQISKPAKKKKK